MNRGRNFNRQGLDMERMRRRMRERQLDTNVMNLEVPHYEMLTIEEIIALPIGEAVELMHKIINRCDNMIRLREMCEDVKRRHWHIIGTDSFRKVQIASQKIRLLHSEIRNQKWMISRIIDHFFAASAETHFYLQ